MQVGSLVRYRERDWVVVPSDETEIVKLRPIGGSGREECGVLKSLSDLIAPTLPYERITTSQFPLPTAESSQDHAAVRLLVEGSRLLLREGAAPFRSLGHVSVRPRPYQFVPLLMALRLETVRLLIADDVGVGKTIEAGLIAREMLDRGEVRRMAVLCPPYLCDQWQKELAEKFQIEAVVVRSGTVSRLERQTPPDRSLFQHFPHLIVSIDLAKSDRYRHAFLQHCPDLVIVDEVHGAAQPRGQAKSSNQQQRHELLKKLAADETRHLIMLTATPHSGVEESFRSILGLIKPKFQMLDLTRLAEADRRELARHFVQRRRGDVRNWMGADTRFPERQKEEKPYTFTPEFQSFYDDVYEFASGLVQSAASLQGWKRRMRFYSALALLRCVASSPAAAAVALLKRLDDKDAQALLGDGAAFTDEALDEAFGPVVYDSSENEVVDDTAPSNVFDTQELDDDFGVPDRKRLRDFARRAAALRGKADPKLDQLAAVIGKLLREGYHPIVWCRYIATAHYVAQALENKLKKDYPGLHVTSVSAMAEDGQPMSEEERRVKIDELVKHARRVLVATDCLSEGVNLQDEFNAVVHYDLPWNPNRLEQREGRVDRFGQQAEVVKVVLIYGQDNPVDGAVLSVLLRKANEIYRRLGVHVPVPVDSEGVMEAVLKSLFMHARPQPAPSAQMPLFSLDDDSTQLVKQLHDEMDRAEAREKESRTRFAQHAIKPEEIERELAETDRVLGTPEDVRRFLQEAGQRSGFAMTALKAGAAPTGVWEVQTAGLPPAVRLRVGQLPAAWRIMFTSPMPEGVTFVGRNHPIVEALAEYLFDLAFYPANGQSPAARCGVIRTRQVNRRTTLLLLRVRYLVYERKDDQPSLAEETVTWGYAGLPPAIAPLTFDQAQALMDGAAADRNVPEAEKREVLTETLASWPELQPALNDVLHARAEMVSAAHQRVRQMLGQRKVRIEPQMPPDWLGVVVLLPVVG